LVGRVRPKAWVDRDRRLWNLPTLAVVGKPKRTSLRMPLAVGFRSYSLELKGLCPPRAWEHANYMLRHQGRYNPADIWHFLRTRKNQ
jgi:hypothetical protein